MSKLPSHPNPTLTGLWHRTDIQPLTGSYAFWRSLCHVGLPLMFKTRVFNRHYEPSSGGVVYICNHQSFIDPLLMAFGLRRPMNFMARESLFKCPGFRELIRSVNAFPIDRESGGLVGMKEAIRRLKQGGQVVVFAEGTRTKDGRIGPLMPGVSLLAKRAARWTVPVVIDGAFEAWPRTKPLPTFGSIIIQYDQPIPQSIAAKMKPQDFVDMVRARMISMQTDMRRRIGRAAISYE